MADLKRTQIEELMAHQEFGSDKYIVCEMAVKYLRLTEPSESAKCAARLLDGYAKGLKGDVLQRYARGEPNGK